MPEQSFESALTECLAAVDAGATVEDVLLRFPAHSEALRPVLGLRAALDARALPLPPTMRARGAARLSAALANPAPSGGIPVLSSLFGLLPKAATQALIALAVTGGAMGASAAAGGPNIPQEVLQAVGLVNENANQNAEDAQAKGKAKGKTAATATGSATADAKVEDNEAKGDRGLRGLCTAWVNGGLGQNANAESKGKGTPALNPRDRLKAAVEASLVEPNTLAELNTPEECTALFGAGDEEEVDAAIASTAESGNQGRGKGLEKSGTAAATAPSGQGKASEAPAKGR